MPVNWFAIISKYEITNQPMKRVSIIAPSVLIILIILFFPSFLLIYILYTIFISMSNNSYLFFKKILDVYTSNIRKQKSGI